MSVTDEILRSITTIREDGAIILDYLRALQKAGINVPHEVECAAERTCGARTVKEWNRKAADILNEMREAHSFRGED